MKLCLIVILCTCYLFSSIYCFAQTDTSFWFAAPEISEGQLLDRPIKINLATYAQPATVTVWQPANNMPIQTINLAANALHSLDLTPWIDSIECKPANTILNYGLKISSTNPVSAYYEVNENYLNPEFYVLKGENALGISFYISSQTTYSNSLNYVPTPFSSFNIIASQNNTQVTITPSNNIVGHLANMPFTITLNQGQTYAAIASSSLATSHLQGSYVTSTKPIAITLSDDLLANNFCADVAGDQTIPISKTGTEYIAVKAALNTDYVYITATQSNTAITVDGILATTINAGQTYSYAVINPNTYIQTTLPSYVYHLTGIGCEVGSAILPPITCSGSSEISCVRTSNSGVNVTLLVPNGGQGNFLLNGVPGAITAASFAPVVGTANQWYSAWIDLTNLTLVGNVINIANTTSLFHLGVMQGNGGGGTGVGYFSNFNAFSANAQAFSNSVCEGDSLKLFTNPILNATYNWSGPNGFTSNIINPIVPNFQSINNGDYYLQVSTPNCGISYDTITINYLPAPVLSINSQPNSSTVCAGNAVTLNAFGANVYSWSNGILNNISFTPTTTNIYTLTATNSNGCTQTATQLVTVNPTPNLIISSIPAQTIICVGGNMQITATGANSYVWSGGITNGISFTPNNSNTYTVVGTSVNGCTSASFISIIVNGSSLPISAGTDVSFCNNQNGVTLNASGMGTISWAPVAGLSNSNIINPIAAPSAVTQYTLTISNAGCVQTDMVVVTPNSAPNLIVVGTNTVCIGQTTTLTVSGASTYTWLPAVPTNANNSMAYPNILASTIYTVIGQSNSACLDTFYASVSLAPLLNIMINYDSIVCLGNTTTLTASGAFTYTWQNSATNIISTNNNVVVVQPTATTSFTITGADQNGCTGVAEKTITIETEPLLTTTKSNDILCNYNYATLTANGALTYNWLPNINLNTNVGNIVVASPFVTTTYTVLGQSYACSTSDTIQVIVYDNATDKIYFPNIFTPNGDGLNEKFKYEGHVKFDLFSLKIYNRFGQVVFKTEDSKESWDGDFNGFYAEQGIYFYVLKASSECTNVQLKGDITLLR
jgi:gliding motility-associated-like protein